MRNIFPGFYSPSEEELDTVWKSDGTLFVFDTNTLLNLYGYASQTRDDFFSILDAISDRIWIPYHVGLEYQRRRLSVVRDEKAIFKKVEVLLSNVDNIFQSKFSELSLNRRFPTLFENTEKLHTDIKKLITSYKRSLSHWDKKQPCVRGHDIIREKLNDLFMDKVGDMPEKQELLKIYKEGKERYKNKVPPGYKDASKATKDHGKFFYAGLEYDRQYGDLLIWKQLISKVKQGDTKAVIFVTDVAKEDWWYIINSRGEKNIGPRAELREEICREGSIDIFTMYNTSSFLDSGKKLLDIDVKDESIDDASKVFFDQVKIKNILEKSLKELNHFNKMFGTTENSQKALEKLRFRLLQDSIDNDQLSKLNRMFNDPNSEELNRIITEGDKWNKILEKNQFSAFEDLKGWLRQDSIIQNNHQDEEDEDEDEDESGE